MTVLRILAASAALVFTGATVQAASFDIAFDAAEFDFDGLFDEISSPGPLIIAGGSPSGLDGLELEFFFDITGAGGFADLWIIDAVAADSFALSADTGTSLVFTGEFADLDFADSDPSDTVVLTISGFAPSQSVIASLAATPDDFFGGAGTVAPIPLPAAAWLLLAGMGALAAAGRRNA